MDSGISISEHPISVPLSSVLPLFERERAAGRALALGIVAGTTGSTYAKAGALIAVAQGGTHAGMISGGCLEGDLCEHAQDVITTGKARLVRYDLNAGHDLLWGLGLGCGGTVEIMLVRVGPDNNWQPLDYFARAYNERRPACAGIVCASDTVPLGSAVLLDGGEAPPVLESAEVQDALERSIREGCAKRLKVTSRAFELLTIPLNLPPRVLVLGGGPDSFPVVDLASRLGWRVTVVDHRPAYADPTRFPSAECVLHAEPAHLGRVLELSGFVAAIVMSHHLDSDAAYLQSLASTQLGYIGLLGPAARRDRLLMALGEDVDISLHNRLRAPIGLPIGGRGPESIALSIVAEVHAYLHAVAPIGPVANDIAYLPSQNVLEPC